MIEAFERNLRLQKIKLRLEEAETEEDLLRICEEYVKSKKPKQDINSFFYEETKNQYSGDPSSQIMKQYIQHPFPGQTTDTIFINENGYNQTTKTPVDLCVESEIDEYTLAKHTSQEQLILVEREKHHLERLIMEELVRSKRIEHTVMVDSYTNKVRLKVRLRG